jgi:hypothetical protein
MRIRVIRKKFLYLKVELRGFQPLTSRMRVTLPKFHYFTIRNNTLHLLRVLAKRLCNEKQYIQAVVIYSGHK